MCDCDEHNSDLNQNIKNKMIDLHNTYNMCVKNYAENGEEDFNCFLDMFKEKENE